MVPRVPRVCAHGGLHGAAYVHRCRDVGPHCQLSTPTCVSWLMMILSDQRRLSCSAATRSASRSNARRTSADWRWGQQVCACQCRISSTSACGWRGSCRCVRTRMLCMCQPTHSTPAPFLGRPAALQPRTPQSPLWAAAAARARQSARPPAPRTAAGAGMSVWGRGDVKG